MSGSPILEARAIVKVLGKGAGEVRALKGVGIALQGGELTLLMGPSGSGKTTLLSILGCILAPTEGAVIVAGNSTKGLKAEGLAALRRDHIGFIFQSYNLFPTLSAEENVKLALDVRGRPKAQAAVQAREALTAVGLAEKLRSRSGQLSGGQQQRVAIARALASRPSVILADEPTAALDSDTGQSIMGLLAELARDPTRAVLAVTHDNRILGFADRIVHIEDGLIVGEERKGSGKIISVGATHGGHGFSHAVPVSGTLAGTVVPLKEPAEQQSIPAKTVRAKPAQVETAESNVRRSGKPKRKNRK